jgi:hypothetical protein
MVLTNAIREIVRHRDEFTMEELQGLMLSVLGGAVMELEARVLTLEGVELPPFE